MIGKRELKQIYRRYKEYVFFNQKTIHINFRGYDYEFPQNHSLLNILNKNSASYEALRENGLVQLVKAIGQTGSKGVFIDIGANVGDTAAILASLSDNNIICIEASSYFFQYLKKNIEKSDFAVRVKLLEGFVVNDLSKKPNKLMHWGGTASEADESITDSNVNLFTIEQLVTSANNVALLKTDIDGGDIKILENNIPLLASKTIPLYFELELPWSEDYLDELNKIKQFFLKLKSNGYKFLFFWDNAGHFLINFNLDHINTLTCMLNFLYQNKVYSPRFLSNYDVACIHEKDTSLATHLIEKINEQVLLKLNIEL